ncbi:aromatic amino acid transaminase [Kordiimonas marina]|uniref:amino acid aminotransferase n=1 Tax=Kordiimonas marina TaxID=2872312 RepID=UPI001FF3ED27|nr:amino acid aminotransferase [Kordiimonas marina]MCJ9429343.1 aspartate/tyrosine/aromatic aminotransferase [Kordiimonas marina]
MFAHLTPLPADPILGLSALSKADTNPKKVDLGVGVYKDDNGKTVILGAVQAAYEHMVETEGSKVYIPPVGWPGFTDACQELVFGEAMKADLAPHMAAIQTPGGCGALRLGFDLVHQAAPETTVWVSNPTWANHVPTLQAAGLSHKVYDYYDRENSTVDVDAMLASLEGAKAGDLVLLHACCHNPTGADLPADAWGSIIELMTKKGLVPFLDMAYQGFAAGLSEDAAGVRQVFEAMPEAVLSYSCSKNFGLYRERTGCLMVKGSQKDATAALTTNLAKIARTNYSMPPAHGAALVTTIMQNEALKQDWMDELAAMRKRINSLRASFVNALSPYGLDNRFGAVAGQTGMFSLLNLTPEQVQQLRAERSIYFPDNGRINVAGMTEANIPYLAESLSSLF